MIFTVQGFLLFRMLTRTRRHLSQPYTAQQSFCSESESSLSVCLGVGDSHVRKTSILGLVWTTDGRLPTDDIVPPSKLGSRSCMEMGFTLTLNDGFSCTSRRHINISMSVWPNKPIATSDPSSGSPFGHRRSRRLLRHWSI